MGNTATVRLVFVLKAQDGAAEQSGDSPSAAAEAAVGPVPLIVAVVVRHYCCCVSEEEVLHVTHGVRLGGREVPDREHNVSLLHLQGAGLVGGTWGNSESYLLVCVIVCHKDLKLE